MEKFIKGAQVVMLEKILSKCATSLPKEFLTEDAGIEKNSSNFKLYIRLLYQLIETIKQLQKEDLGVTKKVQFIRVKKILKLAAKTAWWGDYFHRHTVVIGDIHTFKDFQRIPPVSRNNFIDVPKENLLLMQGSDPSIVWRGSSGSTTGTPFIWGLNKTILIMNVLANLLLQLEERNFSFKKNKDRAFHLHLNMFMIPSKHAFKWFSRPNFYISKHTKNYAEKIEELQEIIENTEDLVILTTPNELPLLIDLFKEIGLRPKIPYFITVGSPLPENIKRSAVSFFKSTIFAFYGAQEMGPCAAECKNTPGLYHPFLDRIIIELLNEDGKPVPFGEEGLVTITCLDNTVMPLLRYQPGDFGVFHKEINCACGNNFPLLEIVKRTSDVVYFSDGEVVPITQVLRFFNRHPYLTVVRRFQVEQDMLDHIIIRLEVRETLSDEALGRIRARLSRVFKGKIDAKIIQTPHIIQDTLKFKVFIPLRKVGTV